MNRDPLKTGLTALILCALCGVTASCQEQKLATAKPEQGPQQIRFQVPDKGFVSLGVYDSNNTLVRSLTYAQEMPRGTQQIPWDATTDLGLPAKPGQYHVKGIWFSEAPRVAFKMKVGISGDPPYPLSNGLGGWGGNLGSPADVAGNGRDVMAVFLCVEDNLNTGVQLMDGDGKIVRRFHTFFPWDIRLACAMDETHAYLAVANLGEKRLVVAKYDLDNPRGKILADIPTQGEATAGGLWKGRWTADVRGLAIGRDRLFVSVTPDSKLVIVDANTGRIVREVALPSPRGIAVRGDSVYVLSGKQLLTLNPDGQTTGTIIAGGLEDPSGLALDAEGAFYVGDGGQSQQVKVFSAEGKRLRTIGIAGGRPREGIYDPQGMLDPRGLCMGPGHCLWVTECNEDFQRISVWDASSGKLAREFFNTRISSGQGRLNPDRTEMLFTNGVFSDVPGISAYKVDFEKGTWYPSWHRTMPLSQMRQDDVFAGNTHIYGQTAKAFDGHHPYLSFTDGLVKADNGRTYAVGGEFSIYLFDPKTCQTKLAAFVYEHRVSQLPGGRLQGEYDQGPNNWLTWSDLNGDGRMSRDECSLADNLEPMKPVTRFFARFLQKDLSVVFIGPDWVVRRLKPRQVLDSGVPVYNWADVETVVQFQKPDLSGGDGWKRIAYTLPVCLYPSDSNWISFAEAAPAVKIQLGGIDGDGWWASRNWRRTPMIYDSSGKPRWLKLGRRAPGRARPGEMYFPCAIAGCADDLIFVPDTLGQMWVWTDTGLYVGKLYLQFDEKGPDSDRIRVELVGAYVYKIGGRIYACAGDHGVAVHQVIPPRLVPIDAGTFEVTPAMAEAAGPWDPDGPVPGPRPICLARSIYDWKQRKNVRTITIDGKLDDNEWSGVPAVPIFLNGRRIADVKVVFDAQHLYLAYSVHDSNGLRNSGQELPYCPFTSGSYVDFCMGPRWDTPQRRESKDGDVRVILARMNIPGQEHYQMAFRPIQQSARGKLNPQTIRSPAAQQSFADISPVPGLTMAYQIRQDGYTLEAKVPLDAVGESLVTRHNVVGFDASVGLANEAGTERVQAAHWAGETEGRVVDRPGSAELRPATWGTLQFDRTPLPVATGR